MKSEAINPIVCVCVCVCVCVMVCVYGRVVITYLVTIG